MDCLKLTEIERYARDDLSPEEKARLDAHLDVCSKCVEALMEVEFQGVELVNPPLRSPIERRARSSPTGAPAERFIGPYRLLEELGRGGQGRVYLAEDTRLRRKVALKLLSPHLTQSPEIRLRFQREADALSRLDHPGICTVYETGDLGETPYIAMRYIEGDTLAQRIGAHAKTPRGDESPQPLDPLWITSIVERAARALHVAHEAGLVHRDIKPSNILITKDDEPVVVDFGLVRDEASGGLTLTLSGELAGTPAYMSPEQVSGNRALLDRRSDVFSLGVTLYEGLTRTLPFDAPTTPGVFQKILKEPPPDVSRSNRHVSRDLKVILDTALEKDPSRRYKTALAFAEDLRRFRHHEPILARPAGPVLLA